MKKHNAFTMIELVFVIVIMGIIGKFGLEFIMQAYDNYIYTSVNNTLQSNSASAVEFISTRLQNRIKNSRLVSNASGEAQSISIGDGAFINGGATILEWISTDVDGFRGNSLAADPNNNPNWSGIIDIRNPTGIFIPDVLLSPATDTNQTNAMINTLSPTGTGINDSAIYFIGSNDGDISQYGWNSAAMADQSFVMHPITSAANTNEFAPNGGTWRNVDVYEYYKLAWTAYAVVFVPGPNFAIDQRGALWLHYDYQPWQGDSYDFLVDGTTTSRSLIMDNVTTFRFLAIKSMIKIQVCIGTDLMEDYSICKEKTIF